MAPEETRQESHGRSIQVQVYGDTASELELAALDEARSVLGADVRLEVVRDYRINQAGKLFGAESQGKRYVTMIEVREL